MTNKDQLERSGRDYGHSGYGHGHKDCEGIDIGLLLTALLGAAAGFFALLTKITMITGGGKRKKRDMDGVRNGADPIRVIVNDLSDTLYGGMITLLNHF